MEINPLLPVGTKLKVDKSNIENLIPDKLLDNLPQIINGEVMDYKMTDGMGIGYVLMTENNLKVWIFSNELDDQIKREYKIDSTNNSTSITSKETNRGNINKVEYKMNGNRDIKTLLNPINLISWLIFTIKDIF
tara:strand:+ start:385 stop:786 length:402 start_codon:yes stop_codon:yes gene_type:complete